MIFKPISLLDVGWIIQTDSPSEPKFKQVEASHSRSPTIQLDSDYKMSKTKMNSSTQFSIRKGDLADVSAIAQFNINIARETEGIALVPQVISDGVRNMMSHAERGFYLVVEANQGNSDSNIAASLMVTTEWSDWRNGTFWWIQSVYVAAPWRRMGLYRMMYEKVKALAAADDQVCGFRLYVEEENSAAQATYQSVGMARTHYQMFEELVPGLKYQET